MRSFRSLYLLPIATSCALVGCATLKPQYVPPTEGPLSTVSITTNIPYVYNLRTYVHGKNVCEVSEAKLVGVLNGRAIGWPQVKEISIDVVANYPVAISMSEFNMTKFGGVGVGAGSSEFSWCQPVVVFTPKPGASYEIVFGQCRGAVSEVQLEDGKRKTLPESTAHQDRSCEITFENQGNAGNGEEFHLRSKQR